MPTLVDYFKDSVNWDNLKCCGKKRLHSTAFLHPGKDSIVKKDVIFNQGAYSANHYKTNFSNHNNFQRDFENPQITSHKILGRDLDFSHTFKRQKLDQGVVPIRSNSNHRRVQSQLYATNTGNLQPYDVSKSNGRLSSSSRFSYEQRNCNSLENQTIEKQQREQQQLVKLSEIDGIIKNKEQEIEQLRLLKEKHMLQQSVNQVQHHQRADESDFLRGPAHKKLLNTSINQKQVFNINGLFDQPFQKTQIFNTSISTLNPGNTNLNNSFDTHSSNHKNNEFSIPFMLPKRAQNMTSSTQTKFSIDSLLDDPLPFSTHLKVSNFNSSLKALNSRNRNDQGRDPQVIYELQMPSRNELQSLKLPQLSNEDVLFVNEELLNLYAKNGDKTITLSENFSLTFKDLRKLCTKDLDIENQILKGYQQILQVLTMDKIQLYGVEDLEVTDDEWQLFIREICSKASNHDEPQSIIFACLPNNNDDNEQINHENMVIFHILGSILRITHFQKKKSTIEYSFKVQFYAQRIKELHHNYAYKEINGKDNQIEGLFTDNYLNESINMDLCIKYNCITSQEQNQEYLPAIGMLYAIYLRSLCQFQDNESKYWKRIEALVKDPQYEEYFRFSFAMQIVKKQLLS